MSNQIFVISDTHFGHENMMKFLAHDGKPMRVFDNASHMDEYIIARWNSVVSPDDKVYHLGDVAMKPSSNIKTIARCNGKKTLILGNHDIPDMNLYRRFFPHIYSTRIVDKLLFSHVPVHGMSLGKAKANIHGHVHNNITPGQYGPLYYNVSIEVLDDYTPISLEDLKARVEKQIGETW